MFGNFKRTQFRFYGLSLPDHYARVIFGREHDDFGLIGVLVKTSYA
jgi:hypothetical protein